MQTRQRASKGPGHTSSATTISLENSIDTHAANSFNASNTSTTAANVALGTSGGIVEQSQVDWVQQMRDLEAIQWTGGDAFYDGQIIIPNSHMTDS
jgi:hypothetical protein